MDAHVKPQCNKSPDARRLLSRFLVRALGRKQIALPERATGRASSSFEYGIWAFVGPLAMPSMSA